MNVFTLTLFFVIMALPRHASSFGKYFDVAKVDHGVESTSIRSDIAAAEELGTGAMKGEGGSFVMCNFFILLYNAIQKGIPQWCACALDGMRICSVKNRRRYLFYFIVALNLIYCAVGIKG